MAHSFDRIANEPVHQPAPQYTHLIKCLFFANKYNTQMASLPPTLTLFRFLNCVFLVHFTVCLLGCRCCWLNFSAQFYELTHWLRYKMPFGANVRCRCRASHWLTLSLSVSSHSTVAGSKSNRRTMFMQMDFIGKFFYRNLGSQMDFWLIFSFVFYFCLASVAVAKLIS